MGLIVRPCLLAGMLVALAIPMASCGSNSGIVPNGQGSYVITKQAATGFPGLGNLKADALQEANGYCLSQQAEGA
jgi:hypothetical protein